MSFSEAPSSKRIAIIGAGWAGLAAAVKLSTAGYAVTVFEAGRIAGGRARRVNCHDFALDNGQHILIGAYTQSLHLMREVGIAPEHVLQRVSFDFHAPTQGFRLRLPRCPAPWHLVLGLLNAQGISWREKYALLRFMRALPRALPARLAALSVRDLLTQYQQPPRLTQLLWEPLCLAALNTPVASASAKVFVRVLRDSLANTVSASDFFLPKCDLGALLPDAARTYIERHGGHIRFGTRVRSLTNPLQIEGEQFAQVILAAAPAHAARLLATHATTAPLAQQLSRYDYEPVATLYLAYPPEVRLPHAMLALTGPFEHRAKNYGQWVFDRGQLCHQAGLMAFVLSAHGPWEHLSTEELAKKLQQELEEVLKQRLPDPLWQQFICEQRASFACTPTRFCPAPQTPVPGLWLAGDYVHVDYPATLEAAVQSGIAAAALVAKHATLS